MSLIVTSIEHSIQPRPNAKLTVADAIWITVARLHKTANTDAPFATEDIAEETSKSNLTEGTHKSIWQHVNQHCVGNRPPQPNRACILFATGQGNRRLFRLGDRRDPGREGGRMHPEWKNLPADCVDLRHWYEQHWNRASLTPVTDPLLALAGLGTGMWDGLDADAYVSSLREGWDGRQ